jgi:hypothetical protein
VLLLFMTESALEMQHILFLFAFFPMLTAAPTSQRRSFSDSSPRSPACPCRRLPYPLRK